MSALRKTFWAAAICLAMWATPAMADERRALVDKIFDTPALKKSSDTYMAAYAREFLNTWRSTLSPMDAATEDALLQAFTQRLSQDAMDIVPKAKEIYLSLFSLEELQAMVDFYYSPVGQRIASKLEVYDYELAKVYYPGINDKAIKHWNDTVNELRAAGTKL